MNEFHQGLPTAVLSTMLLALAVLSPPAHAQTAIDNGVLVPGLSAPIDGTLEFVIEVPEGAQELLVQTSLGTGDADIFIRQGQMPDFIDYDCASFTNGNNDACLVEAPVAGDWFILVSAWEAFDGLLLLATFDDAPAQIVPLEAGIDLPVAGPAGSINWFSVEVPAEAAEVVVEIFPEAGTTGDADLYVRFGERPLPTGADWDCRPFEDGNLEECVLTDPAQGTWYVGVHAWPDEGAVDNVRVLASGDVVPPVIPANLVVELSGARMRPTHTLSWIGGGAEVDVWLNGAIVFTGANTGSYTQSVSVVRGGTTWQVCNAGTDECTN